MTSKKTASLTDMRTINQPQCEQTRNCKIIIVKKLSNSTAQKTSCWHSKTIVFLGGPQWRCSQSNIFWGSKKMFEFRRATPFCLGYCLSKHKM